MTNDTNFDLGLFIKAQEINYDMAYKELCLGKKKTHWVWCSTSTILSGSRQL